METVSAALGNFNILVPEASLVSKPHEARTPRVETMRTNRMVKTMSKCRSSGRKGRDLMQGKFLPDSWFPSRLGENPSINSR